MNDKVWKQINSHLINNFNQNLKIVEFDNYLTNNNLSQLQPNIIYKLNILAVKIKLINLEKLKLNDENYLLILKSYLTSIKMILNNYRNFQIDITNDEILILFQIITKDDVDKAFDCCIDINSFKYHFNKRIYCDLLNEKFDINNLLFDFSICCFLSFDEYLIKTKNQIIIHSNAIINVNWMNAWNLTQKKTKSILINDLMLSNFSPSYLKINELNQDFNLIKTTDFNFDVYENNWHFVNYYNWIINNS